MGARDEGHRGQRPGPRGLHLLHRILGTSAGRRAAPGPGGGGRPYLQLPVSFRDFCLQVASVALPDETLGPTEVATPEGRRILRKIHLASAPLERAWRAYAATGGFPAAIEDGTPSRPSSSWCSSTDRSAPNPRKRRKVSFVDPLLAALPRHLVPGSRFPDEAAVRENVIAVGLFRSCTEGLVQAEAVPGSVAFWISGRGTEVDFAVTSTVLDVDHPIPAIPAQVLMAALAERPVRRSAAS